MHFDSPLRHRWPTRVDAAREIQERLRGRVMRRDTLGNIRRIAGVDIGIDRKSNRARAAATVLSFPECEPLDQATLSRRIRFPYVPGYLSFREVPAVMAVLEKLHVAPDLIICDGQGLAHPRRFGLACHLGVLTGIPTVGAAKSRLVGTYREPGPTKGKWTHLYDGGEVIGAVVRTRTGVSPVYVSIGHKISLPTAVRVVLRCCKRYRLPETTRAAHRLASGPHARTP
ncbi:MAG: deoxyribonuclease V [Arenicellales bacterium]